jgi:hypothetical protein
MAKSGDFSLRFTWDSVTSQAYIARAAPIFDACGELRVPELSFKHSCAGIDTVHNNVTPTLYVHYGWLLCSLNHVLKSSIVGDSRGTIYDPVAWELLNTRGRTYKSVCFRLERSIPGQKSLLVMLR